MIEAAVAWLALIGFEIVQTIRRRPTLSGAAWALGRRRRWLTWLAVGLIAALTLHLLWPLLRPSVPSPVPAACPS